MHRHGGTYSGPSTEAALQRAAAELQLPISEIDHEVLLGSDLEGHVLVRAVPRTTASPIVPFVATLLASMGYDATVKATVDGPSLRLLIAGSDAGALSEEALAAALVHLVKKAAEKLEPGRTLDVEIAGEGEGDRDAELTRLALLAADRCRRYRRPIALPPMNPYERRLLHMAIREHSELSTESLGDGRNRRVVIVPEGEGGGGPIED